MKRFQDVQRISLLIFLRLVSFALEAVRKKVASLLPVLGAVDAVRCALSKAFSLLSGPVRPVRVRVRRFPILAGLAGDRAGLKSLRICL